VGAVPPNPFTAQAYLARVWRRGFERGAGAADVTSAAADIAAALDAPPVPAMSPEAFASHGE